MNGVKAKYAIGSPTGTIANTENVTLTLHYNVQPWVGVLTWRPQLPIGLWKLMEGGVSKTFRFPAVKEKRPHKDQAAGRS